MKKPRISSHLWSIVLAGGEGERVRPLIQRWLGQHKPKQYCAFVGKRSLFQHTLDRALKLTAPEHVVTVIAKDHRRVALAQADGRNAGTILLQPENRDTAAGIFLPLTYLWVRDPDATVILYPSDHFVFPEEGFLQVVERAAWAARWLDTHIILLGAAAHSVELEYGWIYPGLDLARSGGHRVRAVSRFIEKPNESQARAAMEAGSFWNTLVLAAKVETLWRLGWQCLPEMMQLFEELARAIGSSVEARGLQAIYRRMPSRNFSSELLQRVPEQTAMIELGDVLWSDWGKPQRIAATLERIGKQPAFPQALLAAV